MKIIYSNNILYRIVICLFIIILCCSIISCSSSNNRTNEDKYAIEKKRIQEEFKQKINSLDTIYITKDLFMGMTKQSYQKAVKNLNQKIALRIDNYKYKVDSPKFDDNKELVQLTLVSDEYDCQDSYSVNALKTNASTITQFLASTYGDPHKTAPDISGLEFFNLDNKWFFDSLYINTKTGIRYDPDGWAFQRIEILYSRPKFK